MFSVSFPKPCLLLGPLYISSCLESSNFFLLPFSINFFITRYQSRNSGIRAFPWPLPLHALKKAFTTMRFPQFDGQDIFSWLYWCERFFELDQTPEAEKVKMVSLYLDDKTYFQWHCAL